MFSTMMGSVKRTSRRAAPGLDREVLEKLRAEAARRGVNASEIFFEEALESAEPENCLFRYFFLCPA